MSDYVSSLEKIIEENDVRMAKLSTSITPHFILHTEQLENIKTVTHILMFTKFTYRVNRLDPRWSDKKLPSIRANLAGHACLSQGKWYVKNIDNIDDIPIFLDTIDIDIVKFFLLKLMGYELFTYTETEESLKSHVDWEWPLGILDHIPKQPYISNDSGAPADPIYDLMNRFVNGK